MLFLITGLVFAAVGAYGLSHNRRLLGRGVRADAEVVDLHVRLDENRRDYRDDMRDDDRRDDDGLRFEVNPLDVRPPSRRTYYPIVRFRTAEGREVEARTRHGGSPAPASPGDRVRVLYQPDDPQTVSLDTVVGRGVAPMWFFTVLGLAIAVFGVYQMAR